MGKRIPGLLLSLLLVLMLLPATALAETEGDYEYSVDEETKTATITKYNGTAEDVAIPNVLGGYPVTVIGRNAFKGSSVKNVTIPASVESTEYGAFQECSDLKSVTFEQGSKLNTVSRQSFMGCSSLERFDFPEGVTRISGITFRGCTSLAHVTLPSGITFIDSDTFYGCTSLQHIEIPDSVTTIYSSAFFGCSGLQSIEIPDSVTTIYNNVFTQCTSLTKASIGSGINTIGHDVFKDCDDLTDIHVDALEESVAQGHDWFGNAVVHWAHTITANASSERRLTLSKASSVEGKSVTITLSRYSSLKELKVTGASGAEIDLTQDPESSVKYSFVMPGEDVTVTAEFEPIPLTITVIDQTFPWNGEIQGEGDPVYNDPAVIADKISVSGLLEGDTVSSIILDGQGREIDDYEIEARSAVISDASGKDVTEDYAITYEKGTLHIVPDKYEIVFQNDDGTQISSKIYKYGTPAEDIEVPDDPVKEADAQYTYTFAGWIPEDFAIVTASVVYQAKYTRTVNQYTIRFLNEDGTELASYEVAYGEMPEYTGEEPTKDADEQYAYTFAGWDKEIEKVTGKADYTATFTAEDIAVETPEEPPVETPEQTPEETTTEAAEETTTEAEPIETPEETTAAEIMYTVTEGAGGSWTKGSSKTFTFTVKRSIDDDTCFSHYKGTLIDGKAVSVSAKAGSTVVTIDAGTLEKLSVGEHTVTVQFDDGEAQATITVKAAPNSGSKDTPKTGDPSNTGLWLMLAAVSGCGAAIVWAKRKRLAER